jgi:signal transduction histidine kinase/HPt (histidine-containing phosphotransfer) domain-containing protein/AmiR/NasT family two-component response regulator
LYGYEDHITGISETVSLKETAQEMLRLYPQTERIYILNDYSCPRSENMRKEMEKNAAKTGLPVEIVFSEDKPFAGTLDEIRGFGNETLVLIGNYYIDSNKVFYPESVVRTLVSEASAAPVFCLSAAYVGGGTLGGKVSGTDEENGRIAAMAADILRGMPPADIPVVSDSLPLNAWLFDYQTVKKYGIDVRNLPDGHIAVNRALPIWESNPLEFWLSMAIAALLILIICGLGVFSGVLARKQAEAEAASVAKSSFLSNMSHEMRTPLNAIIGLTELTIEAENSNAESYENLEKVYGAGMTLLSIVNDVLDISKIEAGKLELIETEYDIPSMINDTITKNILYIGEKPITFVLNISSDLPTRLYGDELRIKQMLNNLLSNSFKYTKEGTVELGISCFRDNDTVWMTARISDTGIGIRQEDVVRLFSEYSQMDKKANRNIEGTGLGLYITKRIVEMMDGAITVESEYAKGSVFTIKFRQKFVTDIAIGEEIAENLKSFRYTTTKRHRNARQVRISLPYARVLVVDDIASNLDVVKGMMKPYGMQIDCVTSGQEAIDAIREEEGKYAAVFMDHMMPGMDGIEAVRIIREEIGTDYAGTVPIIALTANAIYGSEQMFMENGFQAFISKPIDVTQLDAVIRKWVRDKSKNDLLPDEGHLSPSGLEKENPVIKIPGLNTAAGLTRFGGDLDSYQSVLRSYVANTPSVLDNLRNVTQENLPDYAVAVHGLKGSSGNIGADAVMKEAAALEGLAKAGDMEGVLNYNQALVDNVEKLLDGVGAWLLEFDAGLSRPRLPAPERELLVRLRQCCEKYDMDGIDAIMDELERASYDEGASLVSWLREKINASDLFEAAKRLEEYE